MNNQERWKTVEEVFSRVFELPPEEQTAVLERECAGDPDLLAQVRTLLRHDRSGGGSIADAIGAMASVAAATAAAPGFEGRAMGPYRITREIGRGGMGIVFEALRDDGQFEKRVALKVAANAVYSPDFLTRFRNERQILAGLEHPHIARMLDGGTTPEQIPFFAMEYVEGIPIDQYVETNRLSVPERIRLFLQVCEAVEYAHRNLVIHRDLKPGNILVADGFARLLDFGIAKLAYSDDATVTRAGFAPVTPDYCSPEQLKGEAVTARSDVYSLGLVLYKLLTGERGQKADTSSPVALTRSVCEATPVPPSACATAKGDNGLARQLRGDLDTIAMAAIEKDPTRRYLTVEALAGDLRAHLEGQPIQARQHSQWYRATRFVRRHWVGVMAVSAVILALAAGLVSTAYQAKRAERRFQQVRKLANTLVTDIEVAIVNLPGSTKAQELVLRTAVEYLDTLAAEAGGDTSLQAEVAGGYSDIAVVAYSVDGPSLGRPEEAELYYQKAKAILDPLFQSHPNDAGIANRIVVLYFRLGGHLVRTSKREAGLEHTERAIELGEAAWARGVTDAKFHAALVDAYKWRVANFQERADSGKYLFRMVELAERLRGDDPDTLGRKGTVYSAAAKVAMTEGRRDDAAKAYRRVVELQAKASALDPNNTSHRRNLGIAWDGVADNVFTAESPHHIFRAYGPLVPMSPERRKEAREAGDRSLEQIAWIYQRDPRNP